MISSTDNSNLPISEAVSNKIVPTHSPSRIPFPFYHVPSWLSVTSPHSPVFTDNSGADLSNSHPLNHPHMHTATHTAPYAHSASHDHTNNIQHHQQAQYPQQHMVSQGIRIPQPRPVPFPFGGMPSPPLSPTRFVQQNMINIPVPQSTSNHDRRSPAPSTIDAPSTSPAKKKKRSTSKRKQSTKKANTKNNRSSRAKAKAKAKRKTNPKTKRKTKAKAKSKVASKPKATRKRRPNTDLDPLTECGEYTKRVKPWWLGQRIVVKTLNGTLTGQIKDYNLDTNQVQIWFENEAQTFEIVDLQKLMAWRAADTYKIHEYRTKLNHLDPPIIDYVPRRYNFNPMKIELLQRICVKSRDGCWYTAFVDGYDPISRRHHVNYGDTAEWMWLRANRIKKTRQRLLDHVEDLRTQIQRSKEFAKPPPWDPEPYGLDKRWEEYSKQLMEEHGQIDCEVNEDATSSDDTDSSSSESSSSSDSDSATDSEQDEKREEDHNTNGVQNRDEHEQQANVNDAAVGDGHNTADQPPKKKRKNTTRNERRENRQRLSSGIGHGNLTLDEHTNSNNVHMNANIKGDANTDRNIHNASNSSLVSNSSLAVHVPASSPCTFEMHRERSREESVILLERPDMNRYQGLGHHPMVFIDKNSSLRMNENPVSDHMENTPVTNANSNHNVNQNAAGLEPPTLQCTRPVIDPIDLCDDSTSPTQPLIPVRLWPVSRMRQRRKRVRCKESTKKKRRIIRTSWCQQQQLQTHPNSFVQNERYANPEQPAIGAGSLRPAFRPHHANMNEYASSQHNRAHSHSDGSGRRKDPPKPLPPNKQPRRKNSKYPRIVNLGGKEWSRAYSSDEKKYFWNTNCGAASWNPWHEHGESAPWTKYSDGWTKFLDECKRPYWYHYVKNEATYDKPRSYNSEDEISHDSAEAH